MSDLRAATIHIASDLPVGNPTRKKLLAALKESRRHENPAQQAIWNAWDAMSATEKVREFDSFDGAVGSFGLSASVSSHFTSNTFYYKAGDAFERKLRTIDRQSRSWRTGYNMWLEGYDVDTDRLVADMAKTLKAIKTVEKVLERMAKMARDYPEAWGELGDEHASAMSATLRTISAFDNAIGVVKSHRD